MRTARISQRLRAVTVAGFLVLVLSQCSAGEATSAREFGAGSTNCVPEKPENRMPDGDAMPIFVAESHSYFSSEESYLLAGPHLVVYSDGTAARPAQVPSSEDREENEDPLPPVRGGWIDSCALEEMLAALDEVVTENFGSMPSTTDGGYSTFEIRNLEGTRTTHLQIDQFGLEHENDPDLTDDEQRARKLLKEVGDGVKEAFHDEGELPDLFRLVRDTAPEQAQPDVSWPGIAGYQRCSIFSADPAVEIREKVEEAVAAREDGTTYRGGEVVDFFDPEAETGEPVRVAISQVMPKIDACADLDE